MKKKEAEEIYQYWYNAIPCNSVYGNTGMFSFRNVLGEVKMKKKKEETYQLTFKGFVTLMMDMDEEKTDRFLDALELWLRRTDVNAIILDTQSGGFSTAKVYKDK